MATKKLNVQLVNLRKDGTVDHMNPLTTSKNVSVIPQNNIPSKATNTQLVFNALGAIAFEGGDEEVVFIGKDESEDIQMPDSEINDLYVSEVYAWSSKKVYSYLQQATFIEYVDESSAIKPNCLPPDAY